MDLYILISVLSAMYSWILCAVTSAPTGQSPTASTDPQQRRHVRNKRCSCATFLDDECVYFCHLDIIWVNTPERVVSYGLGNAPRTRRAVSDSMATSSSSSGGGPRCRCFRLTDRACRDFCRLENSVLGYEKPPDAVIRSAEGDGCAGAQCKHKLAADTDRIKRITKSNKGRVSPPAVRAALRTRLLLEKWRARQRHRARAWEGESVAS